AVCRASFPTRRSSDLGWPAEDLAGYVDGEAHRIELQQDDWELRGYQKEAAEIFHAGGSGVVVLPCGAGKTIVGAAAMALTGATTLIHPRDRKSTRLNSSHVPIAYAGFCVNRT